MAFGVTNMSWICSGKSKGRNTENALYIYSMYQRVIHYNTKIEKFYRISIFLLFCIAKNSF